MGYQKETAQNPQDQGCVFNKKDVDKALDIKIHNRDWG